MAGNNGSAAAIPTIAQLRKDNRGGLRGSPFDPFASLRFFGAYGDGSIRDPKWNVRDIEAAFDSPHGAQLEKNFQTLALPIRSAPWEIKDAPGGKAEGDAARDMFGRLFGPLIDRSTNGLWSKKVYHEIEWDLTGREVRIVDLHWRPTGSCSDRRDEHGRLNGFLQRLPFDEKRMRDDPRFPGQVWIEPLRAFVYINGRNRNPILGHSDLQITWALSETIRKLSLILFQFLELQAVPRVLAYGQNETDAGENADQLSQAVGGGVIPWAAPPDGSKPFDVLEASGTGANMFLETLRWLQSQQVSSILADFSTLADQAGSGRGSYALSNDQRAWFEANLQAKATELADQITEQVLRPAALLNFGSDAKVPSMSIGPVSAAEVDNALTMLNSTVTSPNAQVPPGVVDALWVKVSRKLGLDVDQVREAVEEWRDDAKDDAPEGADPEQDADAFQLAHTVDLTYGLVTDALAGVDPQDALERRLELARKVRTPEGSKRYGVPIGSPIPEGRRGDKVKRAAAKASNVGDDSVGGRSSGKTSVGSVAGAKAQAAEAGQSRYLSRNDKGTIVVSAEVPDGAHYRVSPGGSLLFVDDDGRTKPVPAAALPAVERGLAGNDQDSKSAQDFPVASTDLEHDVIEAADYEGSADEKKALRKYTGNGYRMINGLLRGHLETDMERDRARGMVADLENVFDSHPRLDRNVTVLRGLTDAGWMPSRDMTGDQIVNKGFVSTSFDPDTAESFGTEAMFEVQVPRGFKALPVAGVFGQDEQEEHEMVLPHGTIFSVDKDERREVGGSEVRWLTVTALPPTAQTARVP